MRTIREIGGPSSWRGPEMQAHADDWTLQLDGEQAKELLQALSSIEAADSTSWS